MRIFVLVIASLLVWGSCKKKEEVNTEVFTPPYTGIFLFNLLNSNGQSYLSKKESFSVSKFDKNVKIDTTKSITSFEISTKAEIYQGNSVKSFFLNLKENDVDTVFFIFNYNTYNVYDIKYNDQLVCNKCTVNMNDSTREIYKIIKK